jgi:hypothetical protein
MKRGNILVGLALAAWLATAPEVFAQAITYTVDENENGTLGLLGAVIPLPVSLTQDPGPGGLAGALTYSLAAPSLVVGDVTLAEPGGSLSDLVRFNPTPNGGSLVFYSDVPPVDALADIGLPTANYTNLVRLVESGPEGLNNGLIYTPTAGMPGFVTGFQATYVLQSDVVPEPASIVLGGISVSVGMVYAWVGRRRRARSTKELATQ